MSLEMELHELTAAVKELAYQLKKRNGGDAGDDTPPEPLDIRYGNRHKAPANPVPAPVDPEPEPEAEPVSKDDMIQELLEVGRVCGRETLKQILQDHGAASASAVKPKQYASVIKAARTAVRLKQAEDLG